MARLLKLSILFIFINHVFNKSLDGNIQKFIFAYFNYYHVNEFIYFSPNPQDHLSLAKLLSINGMRFNLQNEVIFQHDVDKMMKADYYKLGIILNLSHRTFAEAILNQISKYPDCFNILHYWIVIDMENGEIPNSLDSSARLDSHIFIIGPGADKDIQVRQIYRQLRGPLKIINSNWNERLEIPKEGKRDNFEQVPLKVGFAVVEGSMADWDDWENRSTIHINSANKIALAIIVLVQKYYNMSSEVILTDRWGWKHDENGTYEGLLGLVQTKAVDTASGLLLMDWRMKHVWFCGNFNNICPRFIFRRPPISANKNIYLLAFSTQVWCAFLLVTILSVLALCATEYLGDKDHPFEEQEGVYDYSFAGIAIMTLQGVISSPIKLSSRMVLIFLLILAVIFDNAYSASIVVIFQSPNNFIKTLEDLVNSPFKFMMEDIEYNTLFVNFTNSPLIKKLYWNKLFTQPWHHAFVSIEEGVQAVREGLHAFHVDVTSNKIISDTYDEQEKCALQEIPMFQCKEDHLPAVKGSSLRNHFKYVMLLLNEVGLVKREHRFFYQEFSKCVDQGQGFVSVSLEDIKPVMVLFSSAVVTSIVLLLLEILSKRISKIKINCTRKII